MKFGNSSAEEKFVQLFCELYGPEQGRYVYSQYPFVDIYGKHRTIDYAMNANSERVAIEVDGNTWHQPDKISEEKYNDDLLKQNSMVHEGWKVFRWTSNQLKQAPDRVRDELITFFGSNPDLEYIEDELPEQKGKTFELYEHQEEALQSLKGMRAKNETIALLYHATGVGKTTTAVMDAKSLNLRTLFLAHTKELVQQAYNTFRELWPEVSVGRLGDGYHETSAFVVCATIQSVLLNLQEFTKKEFGYIVIDECHHGTSESYRKILSYFRPRFTLGLTATPERSDGEDLLKIFQKVAHKLDLKTAVEMGALVPVRCIRVKTNIDMSDVRINGFKYNTLDLESRIMVPDRNRLIADTYCEYAYGKKTVIFCTSVKHADEMARLLQVRGINAQSVSGSTRPMQRKESLEKYEHGDILVLCACDLLNEGWDSPHTQVLFMARPTMSKTIYMQQLGRGMRKSEGKDYLMVFDFVDNANMFNAPYSLHRLLNLDSYNPGGLVLGTPAGIKWDQDMFAKGEKPEALVDYPVHAMDYEMIDLFNWQEKASNMISQNEFVRMVSTQSETVDRYIKEEKIIPDMEVPISEHRSFRYFEKATVEKYAKEFGWKLITRENMKDEFISMVKKMQMSYSYKPVFIRAFLSNMDENGNASLEDVTAEFADYYELRIRKGLPAEKKACIFTKGGYTDKDVERLILSMPFKRFEDMHFIRHAKHLGIIQLDSAILKKLTEQDKQDIQTWCNEALNRYFGE